MQQTDGSAALPSGSSTFARSSRLPRILIVDDDPDACEILRQLLAGEAYDVTAETSARRALEQATEQEFDLVLSDVVMPELDGIELCRQVVATHPETPVILLTGRGNLRVVTQALRTGAQDFLTKPIDAEALVFSVARALQRRPVKTEAPSTPQLELSTPALDLAGAVGRSPAMRLVYQLVGELRDSVASVLLEGETGTGKELIARAIHANSRCKTGPFVAVNCAAMPAGLLETELFGHARGAFTDAKTSSKGLLVEANGGTLLLDEIGELPLAMQPKLLRALQERKVRPVGQHEEVAFDCRLITATNRDLGAEVAAKRFREDLFYRLDVVRITVPPLRERGDDVLLIARYLVERFAHGARRSMSLSAAASDQLLAYDWPGNVRELENCIERAVALSRSDELSLEDLPEKIRLFEPRLSQTRVTGGQLRTQPRSRPLPAIKPLFEVERGHILGVIELLGGNKTLAADVLGVDRRTLYRRLRRYEAGSSPAKSS